MAKVTSSFVCQNCGSASPKWTGQCSQCGEWNTLVETLVQAPTTATQRGRRASKKDAAVNAEVLVPFSEVDLANGPKRRLSTLMAELDRVLGGGLVPGEVILIGGEPGIGKSTLLTQLVVAMAAQREASGEQALLQDGPFLYVCGEENPHQIALRIRRLLNNEHIFSDARFGKNADNIIGRHIVFVTTTDVDQLTAIIHQQKPQLVIVDSIQTIHTTDLIGAEGSVGQIRESTQRLTDVAKSLSVPLFLVGHVTKEGTIAGPKVLEHMVDVVLEVSGERTGQLRLVRAIKNRFGATDEVGVFQMHDWGLEEIDNPSKFFLEHTDKPVAGAATVCVMEGTRPLLVEVQALVVSSQLAMPRRVGRGIELNRIQVLAAVLQKHARLPLGSTDIFLSAAGGFSVREPAVDLGLAVAIASSLSGKALPAQTVFVGEVGLLGEIRAVSFLEQRLKEVKRLGYKTIISRNSHRRVQDVLRELQLLPTKSLE